MAVAVSTACLFGLTACGDDDDEPNNPSSTCTCTIKYKSGNTITTTVYPSDVGVSDCSGVRHHLALTNTDASVSCK